MRGKSSVHERKLESLVAPVERLTKKLITVFMSVSQPEAHIGDEFV